MSVLGKKVRIVSKFRFTLFLILFIAIIFNILMFSFNKALAIDYKGKECETYTVKNGDTLWSIAEENTDDNIDIREYLYNIVRLNTIQNNAAIQPGQEIRLPIEK